MNIQPFKKDTIMKEEKRQDITDEVAQDKLDETVGGGSGQPVVTIDKEDDGSRNAWKAFAVVIIIAVAVVAVVLRLLL